MEYGVYMLSLLFCLRMLGRSEEAAVSDFLLVNLAY